MVKTTNINSFNSPSNCEVFSWLFVSFFLFFASQLTAQSLLQSRIDFEVKNVSVEDALLQLSEAADLGILFSGNLFSEKKQVSFQVKNERVEAILKRCLEDTRIDFKLENGNLILFQRSLRKLTLSGFIEDATSGERLIAATIMDLATGKGTTTNEYGFFSLQLIEGQVNIETSYIGYKTDNQPFKLTKNRQIVIKLAPTLILTEIVVTPTTSANKQQFLLDRGLQINQNDLKSIPTVAGETDLFRYLQMQSGVQSGTDGLGGLHIRGGATDQNLVLMDGVPIYNPSHSLGLFSIFNTSTIKTAKLIKDGFSAKYGGRLSSVMDVRIKEGNNQHFSGSLGISALATNILLEGPIVKNKIGFLLSARRSHIDPLLVNFSEKEKRKLGNTGETKYHFFDVNAKVHFNLSEQDRLFFSFYKGGDKYNDSNRYFDLFEDPYYYGEYGYLDDDKWGIKFDWGNQISAFRWNHLFGEKLFANTTLTFSEFKYKSEYYLDIYSETYGILDFDDNTYNRFQSVIQDGAAKIDFDYTLNPKHHFSFGGGLLLRKFKPGLLQIVENSFFTDENFDEISETIDDTYAPPTSTATEYTFYVEDKIALSPNLAILLGVHAAIFHTDEVNYPSIQPRFRLEWAATSKLQCSLSATKMTQFLHVLTSSGNGFPNDMWVPSTANVKPENAWQMAANSTLKLGQKWTTHLAGYYKKMDNLIAYTVAPNVPNLLEPDALFWEEDLTKGDGFSYGAEYQLTKKTGEITGQINYNWIKTYRQFEDLNNNERFPFKNNHEHFLSANFKYQLSDNFAFNTVFEYGSGQQITLVSTEQEFIALENIAFPPEEISSYNGFQLPAYHRLDFSLQANFKTNQLAHEIILGIYNVYNRKNPYLVYDLNSEELPQNNGRKQKNVLPLLPTIGYRVTWND